MGDLSKNFSRSEFACECNCGFDTVDIELLEALQGACDNFLAMVQAATRIRAVITGGNRCVRHNTALRDSYLKTNGKKGALTALNSQHVFARAVDIKFFTINSDSKQEQISPEIVAEYFENHYPHFGVGRYNSRTHIDSRSNGPARWDSST